MRAVLLMLCAVGALSTCQGNASPLVDESRSWLEEITRSARQAKDAIVSSGDLTLLDEEFGNARELEELAAHLPFSEEDRKVCAAAAKAVVDFITAAKAGNMNSGPASYERQKVRWDSLAEKCRVTLVAYEKSVKNRVLTPAEKRLGTLAAAMFAVEDICTTVHATPTFTRFMSDNATRLGQIDSLGDLLARHIAAARRQFDEVIKTKGCRALADELNASEDAKAVGWVLFAGF